MLCTSAIEQNYGTAAILHLLGPRFQVTILPHSLAFAAERVLINGNHFLVRQDRPNLRAHVTQIIARDQRGSKDSPQADVGAIFGIGHAPVADLQHIGIVPMAGPGKAVETVLQIDDVYDAVRTAVAIWPFDPAFPPVLDIASCAPQIAAGVFAPEPGFMGAPLADAEHDRTAGC